MYVEEAPELTLVLSSISMMLASSGCFRILLTVLPETNTVLNPGASSLGSKFL